MAKAAPGSIPLLIHPWGWAWAVLRSRDDGIASLWVQAGTLYTRIFNESHLPAAWTAVSLNSGHKNPGGATIFKCSFTAERLSLLLFLYKCLIIHSCHRLTGAAIFLPAVGKDLSRVVISQCAATAMAISRPHCNLKMLFSTELKKSPWNYFSELYWSVGFLDNSQ